MQFMLKPGSLSAKSGTVSIRRRRPRRPTGKVDVRVEKIRLVEPPALEHEALAVPPAARPPPPPPRLLRHAALLPARRAVPVGALGQRLLVPGHGQLPPLVPPLADAEREERAQRRRVHPRPVRVRVQLDGRVHEVLDDAHRHAEPGRQPVADGLVEVVAPYGLVGRQVGLGHEAEGDAVLLARAARVRKVGARPRARDGEPAVVADAHAHRRPHELVLDQRRRRAVAGVDRHGDVRGRVVRRPRRDLEQVLLARERGQPRVADPALGLARGRVGGGDGGAGGGEGGRGFGAAGGAGERRLEGCEHCCLCVAIGGGTWRWWEG
jgi:hypothetical protein